MASNGQEVVPSAWGIATANGSKEPQLNEGKDSRAAGGNGTAARVKRASQYNASVFGQKIARFAAACC